MRLLHTTLCAAMAAAAIALGSCSNIDEDERLIEVDIPQAKRAVLIEDYTGQWCPNCPLAAEEIESLTSTYGSDKVIAVAIHCGPQGFHVNNGTDDMPGLMTDLGQTYYNHFQIEYQPQGLVDRGGKLSYTDWAAKVRSELQQTALLNINVANAYNNDSRKLNIKIDLESVKGIDNVSGNLQVWLVEDNITSIQSMPDGSYNTSYTHQHVLRDAVNGTWGEAYTLTEDAKAEYDYSYDIPAHWKPTNLSVVAFAYDGGGVQQVVKQPVVSAQGE